jgi:hypothetical protein
MKETRKARFHYNEKEDMFELQINTGDGWGFCTGYRCFAPAQDPDGEKNFISWTVLEKLNELQNLGYEIDFHRV